MRVDLDVVSGICGAISIASWCVVFSPQIVTNFRRSSAEGLSVRFVAIWLLGDFFNVCGSLLQGVLPTMCFYYKGFSLTDHTTSDSETQSSAIEHTDEPTEQSALLSSSMTSADLRRRPSMFLDINDAVRLSPANPIHDTTATKTQNIVHEPRAQKSFIRRIVLPTLFNLTAILAVVVAGVLGYLLSTRQARSHQSRGHPPETEKDDPTFNTLGQIFGYGCAILYLGSRIPQLLLNFRRRSVEGISMLFFLFACHSSMFDAAASGHCSAQEATRKYWLYFAVNLSWLLGSFGTLLLDLVVFAQFYIYRASGTAVHEQTVT
ncbi:hypothetical protein MRB53_041354 [Persea americana]|nr:hypothetical protein MRB53_041354 [Persea americana]